VYATENGGAPAWSAAVAALATAAIDWARQRRTDPEAAEVRAHLARVVGVAVQIGVEADDALRKTLGMPVSPWRQQQLPPLPNLPTRHRTCELR
jgi:hypothetical protein